VERNQTLPVPVNFPKASFETDKGPITYMEDKMFDFVYLSCPGNPSVDSRVFRGYSPGTDDKTDDRPWLFVKQTKHSQGVTNLSIAYLESEFKKWQNLRAPLDKYFRVPYIIFSNRNCSKADIIEFTTKHSGVFVICRANLNEFLPSAFATFAYFEDVDQTFKEDFLPDTIYAIDDEMDSEHDDEDELGDASYVDDMEFQ